MSEIRSAKLSIDAALLPRRRCARGRCRVRRRAARAARRRAAAASPSASTMTRGSCGGPAGDLGSVRADLIAADAAHLPFRDERVRCRDLHRDARAPSGRRRGDARVGARDAPCRPAAGRGAVALHGAAVLAAIARVPRCRGRPRAHLPTAAPCSRSCGCGLASVHVPLCPLHRLPRLASVLPGRRPAALARPRTNFEAAVMMAVAAERRTPAWRLRLRGAIGRSRFVGALDAVGAMVWPKSLVFVARRAATPAPSATEGARTPVGASSE